ncbi:MAG: TIGR02147 family protein [Fibrobacter sp.]|nr:TIGR02147 family protein [Fibrobacter sp.]
MPNIFDYFDYHKYLMDYYKERKAAQPFFSYRYMSQKLDIDAGYLVKVFQGKKNISIDSVPKFIDLLKLNKKEGKYFELLTHFSKSKTNEEMTEYFEKLLPFTNKTPDKTELHNYEFYKKWYYAAIREILGFYRFTGDFIELATMVQPPIKPSEAKKTVALLEKLGLIAKNESGGYSLTSRFITTGETWRSIAIQKYQAETLRLAGQALENLPKEMRDFSTITMSLSNKGFNLLREELKLFRQRVFSILEKEENVNGAYQLNLQLFPISKSTPGERAE